MCSVIAAVSVGVVMLGDVGLMGRSHNSVFVSSFPLRTRHPLWYTLHLSTSNMTQHPALQNFRVDISNAFAMPGTICASVMCVGSQGMSRLHVCVDFSLAPLGIVMVIGRVAIFLFTTGAPSMMKWLLSCAGVR